ncbi:hypothetical protein H5410_001882, partial [Solanum commersonii]
NSPNEIDSVTFYTSSSVPFPTKLSTISPFNTTETNPLTPQAPIDLKNSTPSYQLGPLSTMLADHFFEGYLSLSKSSRSNILAASESIVIESLKKMIEGVIHEAGGTKRNKDDKEVNKKAIIDNLRLQKVLGERVFDTKILT